MVPPGFAAVRVPEARALDVDGGGVLVANPDGGLDVLHPALFNRWTGRLPEYQTNPEWTWFDPTGQQVS